MEREFEDIVSLYGRDVMVYNTQEPDGKVVRAFIQPIREKGTVQTVPSSLGEVKQDRFLYLGSARMVLETTNRVKVQDEVYRVENAQLIWVGDTASHCWAVLSHREKEEIQ